MGRRRRRGVGLRQRLAEVMEPYRGAPDSTRLSLGVDLLILVCIIGSCVLVPLEEAFPEHARLLWWLELGFVAVFVVEYALRWYAAPNRLVYPATLYALIDLVAILPSLLALSQSLLMLRIVRGVRLVRLLRLLRLVRLLRLLRFGFLLHRGLVELRIWLSAVNHQYHVRELGRLFLWVLLAWIVGANLVHFTETTLVGERGPFADYWQSYWHILIVLVSGIEDKEPLSLLGRVEVTLLLVAGICVVGMLTGEIVSILVKKNQRAGKLAIKPPCGQLGRHVVILGRNRHLDNVIRQVSAALGGRCYFLVVFPGADEVRVPDPQVYRRVFALPGDPLEAAVLEQADLEQALRVVVLSSDQEDVPQGQRDDQALMATMAVLRRAPDVPLVVELQSAESLVYTDPLEGVDFLIARHYGEKLIARAVLNPGVTRIYERLMTFTEASNEFYTVALPRALEGKRFDEAQLWFLDAHETEEITLVGIDRSPPRQPSSAFWLNPRPGVAGLEEQDLVLGPGDRLVVMAYERPTFDEVSEEDRWSGKILLRD